MISVAAAKKIIRERVSALSPRRMAVAGTLGLVLAEDVFAATGIPGFPQSSMDGYAFAFDDWQAGKKLPLSGMIAAGDSSHALLQPGTAVRIFTGAALPPGADTVVMQEKTSIDNDGLSIADDRLEKGMFVRPEGAEIKKGELALPERTLLTPAAIGFLASLGITEVLVYPRPVVSIVVTGDELQEPGKPLVYGQVYEANSFSLRAALQQSGIHTIQVFKVRDDLALLTETLKQAMLQADLVFLTGGISVGEFDFVLQASIDNGIEKLFHKIKQRPAKPLFFGKKEAVYVFGLPGNPASGLTSFYEYAFAAIGIMCGRRNHDLQMQMIPLKQPFRKPAGLTHFLKGWYDGKTVSVLDAQESYRLSSFAKANCLVQINEDITQCAAGELVEIHLLPVC
jgi:molybdopterin molybdotransferase